MKDIKESILIQVANDIRYDVYIKRQKAEIENTKNNFKTKIPDNFDYRTISGLSNEILSKLELVRPVDLLQVSRVEGMTPAALTLVHLWIKKHKKSANDQYKHESQSREKSSA